MPQVRQHGSHCSARRLGAWHCRRRRSPGFSGAASGVGWADGIAAFSLYDCEHDCAGRFLAGPFRRACGSRPRGNPAGGNLAREHFAREHFARKRFARKRFARRSFACRHDARVVVPGGRCGVVCNGWAGLRALAFARWKSPAPFRHRRRERSANRGFERSTPSRSTHSIGTAIASITAGGAERPK